LINTGISAEGGHSNMPPDRQQSSKFNWQLLLLVLLLFPATLWANSELRDSRLKVAFVYNFLRFTEWPPETSSPLTLCVANADSPMEAAFNAVIGQSANGRRIRVLILNPSDSTTPCHALFIQQGGMPIALKPLTNGQPNLLTIGDAENFVDDGGVIGLIERDGRLQFEVNLEVARKGNYKLSSQLLKLAIPNNSEKK